MINCHLTNNLSHSYNNLPIVPIGFITLRFSCFKPQVGFLASHGGDVIFTIHNMVKIHNLNIKKLKTIYLIKKKKKTNQNSRLLPPSMSNSLKKYLRSLKLKTKRVYIISSIT